MIYFFADDHYNAHCGKNIYENLPDNWKEKITFRENDWTILESGSWLKDCDVLILNLIGTTCDLPHPGPGAEKAVLSWVEKGGNILLLHGASAAFWQWPWWRNMVGLRWVRPGDPDGIAPSTHPVKPYTVTLSKTRHPLIRELHPFSLEEDEIYTELEAVSPVMVFMETKIEEGSFPQAFETLTPCGGKIVSFLPGHRESSFRNRDFQHNILKLISYLNGENENAEI